MSTLPHATLFSAWFLDATVDAPGVSNAEHRLALLARGLAFAEPHAPVDPFLEEALPAFNAGRQFRLHLGYNRTFEWTDQNRTYFESGSWTEGKDIAAGVMP